MRQETLLQQDDGIPASGVLNTKEILARLCDKDPHRRLIITPLLEKSQVADGAVDIRLSTEFIVTRRTEFPSLDVKDAAEHAKNAWRYQTWQRINFGEKMVLHPNELVLASTFEYICLPNDIFAYVLSRSSWGRLGLVVATATAINPGYKGCLTLEMVNLGRVPLVLYPGLPVAQLILHLASPGEFNAPYDCPTGPEPSNVYSNEKKREELKFWATERQ
ncbi:MAG: dCTP deaminase [candidate division Zixibacteria bacterium]|nr:dCTP deaminase [candidate division Zixibacteria bacterium]